MKKLNILFPFLFLCICLQSCFTPDYEKAIAKWYQTDKNGTWRDMKFKILERLETENVTVADSVRVLQRKFEKEKKQKLAFCQQDIKSAKLRLSFAKYSHTRLKESQEEVEKFESDLDSIQSLIFHSIYEDRDTGEVLVKMIKCKYSIVPSTIEPRQERTDIFVLSPDEKQCIGKMRHSN